MTLDEILKNIREAIEDEQYDRAERWRDLLTELISFQRVAAPIRRAADKAVTA